MPAISSAQEAHVFIDHLAKKGLKAPTLRQHLTQVKPGSFMEWLQQETMALQRIAQKETPEKVLATPALKERFETYYELFMTVEKSFNGLDVAGNKTFGTTLSQGLVKKLADSPLRPLRPRRGLHHCCHPRYPGRHHPLRLHLLPRLLLGHHRSHHLITALPAHTGLLRQLPL